MTALVRALNPGGSIFLNLVPSDIAEIETTVNRFLSEHALHTGASPGTGITSRFTYRKGYWIPGENVVLRIVTRTA
jgi:hypothetical protein